VNPTIARSCRARRRPRVFQLGAKNYITERGAARLAAELQRLREEERPSHVAGGDDLEAKRKLALLDQRLASLEQSLQSAEVVPLAAADIGVVRFGATVTVRRADGEEDQYRSSVSMRSTSIAAGSAGFHRSRGRC
jgi:transcription elongation GreA/GreB family factor